MSAPRRTKASRQPQRQAGHRQRQPRKDRVQGTHGFERMAPGELLAQGAAMRPGCAASALRLAAELRTLAAELESLAGGVLALLADVPQRPAALDALQVPGLWAGEIQRAADAVQGWRVWGLGREVRPVVGLLALAASSAGRPRCAGKGGTA